MWSVFDSADPEGITEHRFDSRLLGQLLGGISSCGFILDLACGRRLRPPLHSSRILSVDWALEALSTIPRAIAADMHLLPISSDSIDGVVSESGLYLAADLLSALGEVARVLVSGGRLLLSAIWLTEAVPYLAADLLGKALANGLIIEDSRDRTSYWARQMTERHRARCRTVERVRDRIGPSKAEAISKVAQSMLTTRTGVIATHTRIELLFQRA